MALFGKIVKAFRSIAKQIFSTGNNHRGAESHGKEDTVKKIKETIQAPTVAQKPIKPEEKVYSPIADFKDIRLVNNGNDYRIEADGKSYSLFQFSKKFGINFSTLYGRVHKGWKIEDIISKVREVKRDYAAHPTITAKLWEWKGEKHTAAEWAKIYGCSKGMMQKRLSTFGSPERNTDRQDAYFTNKSKTFEWNGQSHTAKEWARIYNVPERTMYGRLSKFRSPEKPIRESQGRLWAVGDEKHTISEWVKISGKSRSRVWRILLANGDPRIKHDLNQYTWNGVTKTAKEWAAEYHCSDDAIRRRFKKHGSPIGQIPDEPKEITFNGETHTVREWAQKYKCSINAMRGRIMRHGTPEALPANQGIKDKTFTYMGETHTLDEWAKKYGVSYDVMRRRFKRNRSPEKISRGSAPKSIAHNVDDSDSDLYWCDGECKTIREWSAELGCPTKDIKKNFETYGTPLKPAYDATDESEIGDIEDEEEIDIQNIEELQTFSDSTVYDYNDIDRNRKVLNDLVKAVKQLDKKINKED